MDYYVKVRSLPTAICFDKYDVDKQYMTSYSTTQGHAYNKTDCKTIPSAYTDF